MIQILLATYNSESFLCKQLDSILEQDHSDFQLLIRDGGSSDSTCSILETYCKKEPERIRFLGQGKASAKENFSALLAASDGDLIMFSDHDDVWLPDKISRTLSAYRKAEQAYSAQTPILVFTDSKVVDESLSEIHPSMLACQKLNPAHLSLPRLLIQNVPFGNTMMMNRALRDLAFPIPADAVMHDHWISLVASVFGKIIFLPEPTLLYRQHEKNVYGAFQYSVFSFLKKACAGRKKITDRFYENVRQGSALLKRYRDSMKQSDVELLEHFAQLPTMNFAAKRFCLMKYGIYKTGFLRNLGMFLVI